MPKRLLIVEDDTLLAKVYEEKLKLDDLEISVFNDGTEIFQRAKAEKPNLIILDLMMPNKDGFEVLKELKHDAETSSIPVIVLTALDGADTIDRIKLYGGKEHLVKTRYTFNEVKVIINKYLQESPNA